MVLGEGPTSFFYMWNPLLYLSSWNHTLNTCSLAFSQDSGRPLCIFLEFSLHSCLFSTPCPTNLIHRCLSNLWVSHLSSAILSHSAWILLPWTVIQKVSLAESWGDEGIVELTFSCPGSECPEDTPLLVTPASLEANFSPYLFCLIVSCSECFQILFYLNIENILCLTIPISKVLHV